MGFFSAIKRYLQQFWNWIKKIVLAIINFFTNIVNWFRQPQKKEQLQKNKNLLAVAVKERLANGDFNVINCLFDQETETIPNVEDNTVVMTSSALDTQTTSQFGDKEMIVLK